MELQNYTQSVSSGGMKSEVVRLIEARNIEDAVKLFQNRSTEVDAALREYNTKSHSIMERQDKVRKNKSDYKTNRLPRNWQQYINEIELYFLLNNGMKWELENDINEQEELGEVFGLFKELLDNLHFESRTRESKRIAGAETECVKLYTYYKDDGESKLKLLVLSRSKGYSLRPLFNKYGDLKAFAIGYYEKGVDGNNYQCWDIYTNETIYHCKEQIGGENSEGWQVDKEDNPFHKIPVIYIRQPKAWEGVEERIERDEWLDSKNADCNEYFADPMLKMSKQIKNGLADPRNTGKVVQVNNKDDVFEYVTPPEASDMKSQEKEMLRSSILTGTFTPDYSFENVKGLGAISGNSIDKSQALGYIKRLNRMEIYDEMFTREANLLKEIMAEALYPEKRDLIRKMRIMHIYQDPATGTSDNSEEIQRWAEIGMSDEAIVEANRNVKNKRLELYRLRKKREEAEAAALEVNNNNNE